MKFYITIIAVIMSCLGRSQEADNVLQKAQKNATNFVYEANELLESENFVEAEMAYRQAISKAPNKAVGAYNLGHSYYKNGSFDEALYRIQEAAKTAKTKDAKHRAFHNIGNILMKNEKCKEAVEAFKQALRNNPADDETRYNFALAKACAEEQKQDGGGEDDKEDKDKEEEKDKEDEQKKEDQNKDNKDEGDKDKKEGDKEEDENGKPKDDKKDDGKGEKDKKDNNEKPKPGQMSPQQIKNILEAMQNQEQKVQEKMNAEKQKGAKVKTEKDW